MTHSRANTNLCDPPNRTTTLFESKKWRDNNVGRLPSSDTKTWWRVVKEMTMQDPDKPTRKPRQLGRLIKGYGSSASSAFQPKSEHAPAARKSGLRLAKRVGAKAWKWWSLRKIYDFWSIMTSDEELRQNPLWKKGKQRRRTTKDFVAEERE